MLFYSSLGLELATRISLAITIVISASCASVSLDQPKVFSRAIVVNSETEFGQYAKQWEELHGDQSGFFPLAEGMDALGARLNMADKAQKSIDLQYFLMSNDTAGVVMADALLRAADRGVRIRFLLDDIFTTQPDSSLQLLNRHPNIEVRMFNPISRRGFYYLNFLGNFKQANRRMHNKSFTVDNAISIVGGRNIADEYFQLKKGSSFADFDMIALGPIAQDISNAFDIFWNYDLAIPIEQLSNNAVLSDQKFIEARNAFSTKENGTYERIYQQALESQIMQDLMSGKETIYAANTRVLMDNPDKLQNPVGEEHMDLAVELGEVLNGAKKEVIFLTPYYVPGDDGVEFVRGLVDKGLDILVLTNSLASTNHIAVHSGYARYRKDVIDADVKLYEIRADTGRELPDGKKSERLTLHTKLILIDRRYLFVGSLNLDPRSLEINSEMGILIDSEELVSLMAFHINEEIPLVSYHVIKNEKGKVEWHGIINESNVIETSEPESDKWLRFKAWLMKIAPEKEL